MLDVAKPTAPAAFPIVGVGASAGGLEAFTQLLGGLPPDTGLSFVLIQHLDRSQPSLLREALAKATTMPVQQAEQGMQLEPSHVYVIAPNTDMVLCEGRLVLSPRPMDGAKQHLPADLFLRSLADEMGNHAIGMILSGSASDGTDGLRAIRTADGITFAQDPQSAKFPGMPQSAIDAGVVDYCLDIPQIVDMLVRLSRQPELAHDPESEAREAGVRNEILACVRAAIGVDFSEWKLSTVSRRLSRRMALRNVPDLTGYLALLQSEPKEIRALYEDMLIHVTQFFRDPEMFEALRTQVFPQILLRKHEGDTLRIWVAGCSSGEEVYSLAIALLEFLAGSSAVHPIQIFASDVSESSIARARAGSFNDNAMRAVSDERRKRYFTKTDNGYRINKAVRDLCVFVRHDLVRDPPFSKLDLASCRNLLIYFEQPLQKKVLSTLHYCLNQPGFLLLGHSENVAGFSQLFSTVDKTNKIFARTSATSNLRFAARTESPVVAGPRPERGSMSYPEPNPSFAKHLDRLLLARYSPPAVLINERMDVLLFSGPTGSFLQAAPGRPQNNLVGMARGGLVAALRATLAQAKRDGVVVRCRDVEVDQDGPTTVCDLVVVPFSGLPDNQEPLFVVLFEASGHSALDGARHEARLPAPDASADKRRIGRLEHELASTKEYLHTLAEEHGRASDELGTSNEELTSGNEELQSMNEELETAKEELQSTNEELSTLNDELRARNQEVTQVNSDLLNFALTVDIAVVTLDMQRCIRRFTPKSASVLGLVPSDVGRSIDSMKLKVDVPDLSEQISAVIETEAVKESQVQDKHGHWYRMQIRPYTTADNLIDGVILSLVDINALKQLVAEAQEAGTQAERANGAKDDFLATLSHELRTPLSSMLLHAQRLRSGNVMTRADLQRAGEALERATFQQVKLIDDLLDVSRVAAGKLSLELAAVDLCSVVREVIESATAQIEAKALNLHVVLEPGIRPILADRVRVQQVVSNLLSNAVKFTPRGGQVTITVDMVADAARLRVTDTGIGIEAEFLPRVFARFSQSDSSITRHHGGLGLGLALVKHLVELQAGTVHADSAGQGHGATFTVLLPLVSTQEHAKLAPVAPSTRQALDRPGKTRNYDKLANLRVLFVDDDLRTREAVLEVLQLSGARVELAASVAEGLLAVEAFKPQVIMCDIAMPGEDGYAFVRKLRAREAGGARIPALALTALASEEDRRRAIAAGFQLHVSKPIDIDRLREAVLELAKLIQTAPPLQVS